MISVDAALEKVLALFDVLPIEDVPLEAAGGRTLARPLTAPFDQPPFPASAMDGYAIAERDFVVGTKLSVIGESAAGHRFNGDLKAGETVRIFTGAPVPRGADRILIQEDAARDGDQITVASTSENSTYIRPAGTDFQKGFEIPAGNALNASDIGLIAAMGHRQITVTRKPVIALIATGDELVAPGGARADGQIFSSNNYALKALIEANGGIARLLPIARDSRESLTAVYDMAKDADAIVTLGGASVGDHDLVADVGRENGLVLDFYKIAMRPGKPLMAGRMEDTPMIGLPGNPVSSIVCAYIFLIPALRKMLGRAHIALQFKQGVLAEPIAANGPRMHFMRGKLLEDGRVMALPRQDSALLSVLAGADILVKRDIGADAANAGDSVAFLPL